MDDVWKIFDLQQIYSFPTFRRPIEVLPPTEDMWNVFFLSLWFFHGDVSYLFFMTGLWKTYRRYPNFARISTFRTFAIPFLILEIAWNVVYLRNPLDGIPSATNPVEGLVFIGETRRRSVQILHRRPVKGVERLLHIAYLWKFFRLDFIYRKWNCGTPSVNTKF